MKRIAVCLFLLAALLTAGCGSQTTPPAAQTPAETPLPPPRQAPQKQGFVLALYCEASGGLPAYAKFAGYNTVEILDHSFALSDAQMANYLAGTPALIDTIHNYGLQVYVILLTNESRNLNVRNIASNLGLNDYQVLFNPVTQPAEFNQRITDVRQAVHTGFAAADGFEVFAGDPGGCVGSGCEVDQYIRFAKNFASIVRELGTPAEVTWNTWAIANWGVTLGVGLDFWDAETSLSKGIIAGDLSYSDAITLPGHNFYRFLTLQLYTQAGREVPNWPDRTAIDLIKSKGKRAYLWPHFIVDDDPARPQTWQKMHFEVRYLQNPARKVRDLGMNGVFVNCYNCPIQMGNIYAYGQLTKDPDKSPQEILKDFATLVAQPSGVDQLTQVFIFMENHSWWGHQMPAQYQLPSLPGTLTTYDDAIAALNQVMPLSTSSAPLLMNPRDYLTAVGSTLLYMRNNYGF